MNTGLTLKLPEGFNGLDQSARSFIKSKLDAGTISETQSYGYYTKSPYINGRGGEVSLYRNGDTYKLSTQHYDRRPDVGQTLKKLDEVEFKHTRVHYGEKAAVLDEVLFANGDYQVNRYMDGKHIGGYECNLNEVGQKARNSERKLLTGLRGRIERIAMNIAQDANGCERPVLRKISGKIIDILRRVK